MLVKRASGSVHGRSGQSLRKSPKEGSRGNRCGQVKQDSRSKGDWPLLSPYLSSEQCEEVAQEEAGLDKTMYQDRITYKMG